MWAARERGVFPTGFRDCFGPQLRSGFLIFALLLLIALIELGGGAIGHFHGHDHRRYKDDTPTTTCRNRDHPAHVTCINPTNLSTLFKAIAATTSPLVKPRRGRGPRRPFSNHREAAPMASGTRSGAQCQAALRPQAPRLLPPPC